MKLLFQKDVHVLLGKGYCYDALNVDMFKSMCKFQNLAHCRNYNANQNKNKQIPTNHNMLTKSNGNFLRDKLKAEVEGRKFSSESQTPLCPLQDFSVVRLASKSILRLSGVDNYSFLQGLITNDIDHLSQNSTSLYSQLLTIKGRVLCDFILYKDGDDILLESDVTQKELIAKALKKYKIRKKVQIYDVSDELLSYAVFGCQMEEPDVQGLGVAVHRDPRLNELGWRLLAPSSTMLNSVTDETVYHRHRYRLGVGEGPLEHLPEKSLPLECNLHLLNGVSFNKGCFIGQELTSRTHHTGVIRKRIMPVETTPDCPSNLVSADVKLCSTDKSVGTIRGIAGGCGVALLRVAEVLKPSATLYTTDSNGEKVDVKTRRPDWWPDGVGVI